MGRRRDFENAPDPSGYLDRMSLRSFGVPTMNKRLVSALAILAVAAASLGLPGTTRAAEPNAVHVPKVVIVVGATGSVTSSYRSDADRIASTFSAYTSNIVKVYSPNATWGNVQAAAIGANFVVYLGHGSTRPSPYPGPYQYWGDSGMGLNASANNGDSNTKYYGENYMAQLGLAPNALVMLHQLCYASGNLEWGQWKKYPSLATLTSAKQRVDNYASGFLRAGASAVIAEGLGSLSGYIRDSFTTSNTIDQIWKSNGGHGNVISFASVRTPGMIAQMDPNYENPASDGDPYYRSMVGTPSVKASQITSGQLNPNVERWFGTDRYSTAAAISGKVFTSPVPVAFIATAANFPDALAGAAAAAKLKGPMLLVTKDAIPDPIAAELTKLKPAKIVVLGGISAVSDEVFAALDAYTTGAVERWSGSGRYETAAVISSKVFSPGVPYVLVATGTNFPDALAGAAAAGKMGVPVLLVTPTSIPTAVANELTRLHPPKIAVLGSPTVVAMVVQIRLGAYVPAP
jgi:hypothetical protein